MINNSLGIYDIGILMGTFLTFTFLISSIIGRLYYDFDEVEYSYYYIFTGFFFWLSTIAGIGIPKILSDTTFSLPFVIIVFTIYAVISVTICIILSYINFGDTKQSVFYSSLSISIINLTVSIVIVFGETSTTAILRSPDLFSLNGGIGFIAMTVTVGFVAYLVTQQLYPQLTDLLE